MMATEVGRDVPVGGAPEEQDDGEGDDELLATAVGSNQQGDLHSSMLDVAAEIATSLEQTDSVVIAPEGSVLQDPLMGEEEPAAVAQKQGTTATGAASSDGSMARKVKTRVSTTALTQQVSLTGNGNNSSAKLPKLERLLDEWGYLQHPEPEARVAKPPIAKPEKGPAIQSIISFVTLVQDMCKPLESYDVDSLLDAHGVGRNSTLATSTSLQAQALGGQVVAQSQSRALTNNSTTVGNLTTTLGDLARDSQLTSLELDAHESQELFDESSQHLRNPVAGPLTSQTTASNSIVDHGLPSVLLQRDLSVATAPSGAVNPYLVLDNDPGAKLHLKPEAQLAVEPLDPSVVANIAEDYTEEWRKMTAKVYTEKTKSWIDENCLMTPALWKLQSTEQQRAYLAGMADCLTAISKGRVKIFENPEHVQVAHQMRPAGGALDKLAQAILVMQRQYAVDGVDYQFSLRAKTNEKPKPPRLQPSQSRVAERERRIAAELSARAEKMSAHSPQKHAGDGHRTPSPTKSSMPGLPAQNAATPPSTRKKQLLPALSGRKKSALGKHMVAPAGKEVVVAGPFIKQNPFIEEMERRAYVPVRVGPADLKKRRREAYLQDIHLSAEVRYDLSTNHNSVQRKEVNFEPLYEAVRSDEAVEQVRELVALQNPLQARAASGLAGVGGVSGSGSEGEEDPTRNNTRISSSREPRTRGRGKGKKKKKDLFSGFADLESYKTPEMEEYQSYPLQMVRFAEWVFQEFGAPDKALRALDENGNGILSLPEFLIAMKKRMPLPFEVDLKLIFSQLDVARKGLIAAPDVLVLTRIMDLRAKIEHDVATGMVEKMLQNEREEFVSPFRAKVHAARNAIQWQHAQFMGGQGE
eukprot:g9559.t1